VEVAAEQLLEPVAVTVLDDLENSRLLVGGGPHRAVLTSEIPASLINIDRAGSQHLAGETLVRSGEQR
jgi:hypothetical protein